MATSEPRTTWDPGYTLLLTAPFIGVLLILTDPPQWLQITGALAIVVIVGVAWSMIRRRSGGWRPSEGVQDVDHPAQSSHDDR